jgi:predicted Zn-dependent protease
MISLKNKIADRAPMALTGLAVLILLNAAIYMGCAGGINLFAKSDDVKLGQQMQAEIAKNPSQYPVYNDPALRSYFQNIENTIVSSKNVTNKDFNYQVTIINDPNTINAFSIPGGPMYVYTGLIKFVDNEATMAGVLAHETTHADHRHGTRQMTQAYGMQTIAAIALGNNPGALQAT